MNTRAKTVPEQHPSTSWRTAAKVVCTTLIFGLSGLSAAQDLEIDRSVPAYFPGQTLDVMVFFTDTGTPAITSLGIIETLPTGWEFLDVSAGQPSHIVVSDGIPPNIVEFALLDLPSPGNPLVFTYRITPSLGSTGSRFISGVAVFSRGGGGPGLITVPNIVTKVEQAGEIRSTPASSVLGLILTLSSLCVLAFVFLNNNEKSPRGA